MNRPSHQTLGAMKNAVVGETYAEFATGARVQTVDGYPGRVTAVLDGPFPQTETYEVALDNGLGGGEYTARQLRPLTERTAAVVEEPMAVEASDIHLASEDSCFFPGRTSSYGSNAASTYPVPFGQGPGFSILPKIGRANFSDLFDSQLGASTSYETAQIRNYSSSSTVSIAHVIGNRPQLQVCREVHAGSDIARMAHVHWPGFGDEVDVGPAMSLNHAWMIGGRVGAVPEVTVSDSGLGAYPEPTICLACAKDLAPEAVFDRLAGATSTDLARVTDHQCTLASHWYPELGTILYDRPPNERVKVYASRRAALSDDAWDHHLSGKPAHDQTTMPTLYHGTHVQFEPGDHVEPGHPHNFPGAYESDEYKHFVHATPSLHDAWMYADNAHHENGGAERHVYEVAPTGFTSWGDETFPDDFDSDEDMHQRGNRMSSSPFKVVREVPHAGEPLSFTDRMRHVTAADVEQIPPPSACSWCGHDQFTNPTNTGRGMRMECAQCGGTMTSWGGQWQPDMTSSPENHPRRDADSRAVINDPAVVHASLTADSWDHWLAPETTASRRNFGEQVMARYDLLDLGDPAAAAVAVDPRSDPVGYLRELTAQANDDPDLGFHMLATWAEVREKAKRIKDSGGVRILAASAQGVVGEVQGEHALYESSFNFVPGTRKLADWSCGCKWGAYAWGRSPAYRRFEGRKCSHVTALQFEAQSSWMFGGEVQPDLERLPGQYQRSPVTVQYERPTERADGGNLNRRSVPPGNMRRTFSSSIHPDSEYAQQGHDETSAFETAINRVQQRHIAEGNRLWHEQRQDSDHHDNAYSLGVAPENALQNFHDANGGREPSPEEHVEYMRGAYGDGQHPYWDEVEDEVRRMKSAPHQSSLHTARYNGHGLYFFNSGDTHPMDQAHDGDFATGKVHAYGPSGHQVGEVGYALHAGEEGGRIQVDDPAMEDGHEQHEPALIDALEHHLRAQHGIDPGQGWLYDEAPRFGRHFAALDLAPVHAFAREMAQAGDTPDAVLRMLAHHGVPEENALRIIRWAVTGDDDGGSTQPGEDIPGITTRDTTEFKKRPHHHDHHTNDTRRHAPDFGRGIGWYAPGLMWCDQCNGSGCGHCFLPGTLVRAEQGYVPIETIRVGDRVLGEDGKYHQVQEIMVNDYEGTIYGVQSTTMIEPVWMTHDHPVRVLEGVHRSDRKDHCRPKRCDHYLSDPNTSITHKLGWKKAEDLVKTDWLVAIYPVEDRPVPVINIPFEFCDNGGKRAKARQGVRSFVMDSEFAWIIGLYLAEGWGDTRKIAFGLHVQEDVYQKRVISFFERHGFTAKLTVTGNRAVVRVYSTTLSRWFPAWLGSGCQNKQIPEELMALNAELTSALIQGIFDGDASKRMRDSVLKQTSPILALQCVELLHRIGSQPLAGSDPWTLPAPSGAPRKKVYFVNGTEEHFNKNRKGRWNFRDQLLTIVRKLETSHYIGKVYNFSVAETPTYVVQNILVHNCGGTGQVMQDVSPTGGPGVGDLSSTTSPIADEDADAGEDVSGGLSTGATLQQHQWLLQHYADASTTLMGGNPAPANNPLTPHSDSRNPGSTGWATSADPHAWTHPIINNSYEIAAEASRHRSRAEGQDSLPEYTHAGVAVKAADTGRVLMIQRSFKDDSDPAKGTWEFPGGGKEDGDQTSLHTAVREWQEEVGQPFPEGGHVSHTWRAGTYHGHVVTIPSESQVDFSNGRSTVNPDDPDGDDHEQSAWWDPQHAKKNPALRQELKKDNPFGAIEKAAAHYPREVGHDELGELIKGYPVEKAKNWVGSHSRFVFHQNYPLGRFSGDWDEPTHPDDHAADSPHAEEGYFHNLYRATGHGAVPPVVIEEHHWGDGGEPTAEIVDGTHRLQYGLLQGLTHMPAYVHRNVHSGASIREAHFLTLDQVREIARTEKQRTGKSSEQLLREHVAWQEQQLADWHRNGSVTSADPVRGNPEFGTYKAATSAPTTAELHDEPEPALPSTDGGIEDDSIPEDGTGWQPGDPAPGQYLATQPDIPWGYPGGPSDPPPLQMSGSLDDVPLDQLVATFQSTAMGRQLAADAATAPPTEATVGGRQRGDTPTPPEIQAENAQLAAIAQAVLAGEIEVGENGISKSSMKNFDLTEQQELITEGANDGTLARNFDGLQIEGTHYALLDDPDMAGWM